MSRGRSPEVCSNFRSGRFVPLARPSARPLFARSGRSGWASNDRSPPSMFCCPPSATVCWGSDECVLRVETTPSHGGPSLAERPDRPYRRCGNSAQMTENQSRDFCIIIHSAGVFAPLSSDQPSIPPLPRLILVRARPSSCFPKPGETPCRGRSPPPERSGGLPHPAEAS